MLSKIAFLVRFFREQVSKANAATVQKSEMKVSDVKQDGDTLTFKLSSTDHSIANAIRRVLIAEIPTWAFATINVEENITPFSDEYISHRVGLIPLNNELIKGEAPQDFTLDVKGPKAGIRKVYSQEIKPKDIVFPGIVIAELKGLEDKQEHLKIKMSITRGTHQQIDARHSAVSIAAYKQVDETTFEFTVETRGLLKFSTLMKTAFQVIVGKLELVLESINEPNTTKLEFYTTATDLHKIKINNEDDTLGNLVQTYIMKKHPEVFVAYNRPHPLENHIVISIKEANAKNLFEEALKGLIGTFKSIDIAFGKSEPKK